MKYKQGSIKKIINNYFTDLMETEMERNMNHAMGYWRMWKAEHKVLFKLKNFKFRIIKFLAGK